MAPDEGAVKRCTSLANDLNLDFALITNRKPKDKKKSPRKHHKNSTSSRQGSVEPEESQSENSTRESESDAGTGSGLQERKITRHQSLVHHSTTRYKKISLSGSVSGRKIIVVDDMIDTGQTIKEAMEVNLVFARSLKP